MRWNKLKRMAFDHPYFEYKKHLLSEAEAERILSKGYIGIDEFMRNVRARCEQTGVIPVYRSEGILQTQRKHRHIRGHLVRRLAIACIVLLCLTTFFTLTKPGVALATSIRNFIVHIFDGSLNAQGTEHSSGLPSIDFENIPDTFSSLDEVAKIIGRPVAKARGNDSDIVSIRTYILSDSSLIIKTEYRTSTDKQYYVTQEFIDENETWSAGASTGGQEVIETILPNGITIYTGYFDDGMAFGEAFGYGININIQSVELTPGDILDIAYDISFIHP